MKRAEILEKAKQCVTGCVLVGERLSVIVAKLIANTTAKTIQQR